MQTKIFHAKIHPEIVQDEVSDGTDVKAWGLIDAMELPAGTGSFWLVTPVKQYMPMYP